MIASNEPVLWLADGSPHSPRFNDRYRSQSGGLSQAWTVFLQGSGLPDGWHDKSDIRILETGFGLGLNFLATWAHWEADVKRSEQLHYWAVEGYPVSSAELVRNADTCAKEDVALALGASRLTDMALELADQWAKVTPGINVLNFSGGRVQMTLAVGDVLPMLRNFDCSVDAVYLDGFSPKLNPEMWSPSTLEAVASHCYGGTRLATYTIAKSVRQTLQALGFEVKKCPGLPPKRDRLEGVFLPSHQ